MPRQKRIRLIRKKGNGMPEIPGRSGNENAVKSGAFSDLSRRNLDGRSKLARALRAVEAELVDAIGGSPSPQQLILIQRVTYKLARITFFETATIRGDSNSSDDRYLAWANSIRLDLQALGLERQKVTRDITAALAAAAREAR
jgi:hypothetical protein